MKKILILPSGQHLSTDRFPVVTINLPSPQKHCRVIGKLGSAVYELRVVDGKPSSAFYSDQVIECTTRLPL